MENTKLLLTKINWLATTSCSPFTGEEHYKPIYTMLDFWTTVPTVFENFRLFGNIHIDCYCSSTVAIYMDVSKQPKVFNNILKM